MKKKKRQLTYEDVTKAILGPWGKKIATIAVPVSKVNVLGMYKVQPFTPPLITVGARGSKQTLYVDKDGVLKWSRPPKHERNGLQVLRLICKKDAKKSKRHG